MIRDTLRRWAANFEFRDAMELAAFGLLSAAAWQWNEIAGTAVAGGSLLFLSAFGGRGRK